MCTSPLKGFPNGKTKNGKTSYIICSGDINHVELGRNGSIFRAKDSFISDNAHKVIFESIDIPCGQCLECRLEYSRQWANRCVLEASEHDKNCFITLTYDDLHIPINNSVNSITGEITKVKTLVKRDLQLFMKRLRKELDCYGIKIRYFACGEYGSKTQRPHYHIIIFGWKPNENDLHFLKQSPLGDNYFYSDMLEKLWPYGNNLVAECTWETCAYVARYVTKKVNIDNSFYKDNNIEKEFITMSRRPGIGLNWYITHSVSYATFLNQYLNTEYGSRKISHNRYFDSYLEKEDPVAFEKMKEVRKIFQKERKKMLLSQSDMSYLEQLEVKGKNLEKKTKILSRGEI